MARRFFQARSVTIAAVCAVVVVVAAAATSIFHSQPKVQQPSLQNILDMPSNLWQLRLFSGARDLSDRPFVAADRAVEKLNGDYAGVDSRYQTDKDRSMIYEKMQPDGVHKAARESYYAPGAGEEFWRPLAETSYTGDNQLVKNVHYRGNGSVLQRTLVTAGGAKTVIDYADDGVTHIGETLYDPPPDCCDSNPVLKSEKRWLSDGEHSLVYLDLTAPDGKRTKTKFDAADHSAYWIMACADNKCSPYSAIVTAYFPHTHIVQLESKTSSSFDEVKYYHEDGKLWFDDKIGSGSNDVTYYDENGVKPVLEQYFTRLDEFGPNREIKLTAKSVYEPFLITEFNAAGLPNNVFFFEKGKLSSIDAKEITLNGVFYKSVSIYLYPETGEFHWGNLFSGDSDTRIEVHPETWTMPPLPHPKPEELKMIAPFIEDLPVPPPQTFHVP